jgi:acyl carrier protein
MSIDRTELLELIKQFFLERGVVIEEANFEAYNFIAQGSLDSFEVLSLIMNIETQYGLSVPAELMLNEKNAQIGNLVNAILEMS